MKAGASWLTTIVTTGDLSALMAGGCGNPDCPHGPEWTSATPAFATTGILAMAEAHLGVTGEHSDGPVVLSVPDPAARKTVPTAAPAVPLVTTTERFFSAVIAESVGPADSVMGRLFVAERPESP